MGFSCLCAALDKAGRSARKNSVRLMKPRECRLTRDIQYEPQGGNAGAGFHAARTYKRRFPCHAGRCRHYALCKMGTYLNEKSAKRFGINGENKKIIGGRQGE